MCVIAVHVDAGGAKTGRLDTSKILNQYFVRSGVDAVCEVAGCRQHREVVNVLAGFRSCNRIIVDAGRRDVFAIDNCHITLLHREVARSEAAREVRSVCELETSETTLLGVSYPGGIA